MIAIKRPPFEPDEPFHGYRVVRGMLFALVIELSVAACVVAAYYGCHQGP